MRTSCLRLIPALLLIAIGLVPHVQAQPPAGVGMEERPPSWSGAAAVLHDLKVERFSVEDGLPHNAVVSIAQDALGFLWLATQGGLVRYDGTTFRVYTHDPADPGSLSHSWAEAVYVDAGGTLWVGTFGWGLNRFDPATETFTRYRHDPDDPTSLSGDLVTQILEDHRGQLWVGTHSGLNRFDPATETFTRYRHDPADPTSLSDDEVRVLYEDRRGQLWVGTGDPWFADTPLERGGLNRFDPATGTFTRYVHDPDDPATLLSNRVQALFEDARGQFWVGTLGGVLHRMDRAAGTFERYHYDPSRPGRLSRYAAASLSCALPGPPVCGTITFIDEDASGVLWIGAFGQGLLRYDPATGAVRHHGADHDDPNSLANDWVWRLAATRDGTRWIGNVGAGGLYRLTPVPEPLPHYVREPGNPNSLSHNSVYGLHADADGLLWVATEGGGLNRFDPQTGRFTHYRHDPDDPHSLSSDSVNVLYEDRQGALWIGTWSAGLNRFDKATGRVTRYRPDPSDPHSLSHPWVKTILEDRQGRLWVGTDGGGLNRFDPATETFTHYRHDPDDPRSLRSDVIRALHEDAHGRIWIGTGSNHLVRFDPEAEAFTAFSFFWVLDLFEDRSGRLWAGTDGGGLHRIDLEAGPSIGFTTAQGLPNNDIAAIIEDDAGRLWVSTYEGPTLSATLGGLARLDSTAQSFRALGALDGLPPVAFHIQSATKDRQGRLYFGGPEGFVAVDPDALAERPAPEVVLTDFRLFNDRVVPGAEAPLQEALHGAREIRLAHTQHDFTIGYVGLDFQRAGRLRYQYMLENHDEDWVEAGAQRSARYSRLAPGRYVFRVRAARPGGGWGAASTAIGITMVPPWWRAGWAYVLYGVLIAAGVVAVDRARRRRLIRRERQRAQVTEVRLRAEALQAENRRQELELEKARALEAANARLEEQAERLVELDRIKSRFFANISHEFRTPLTLLLGPIQDAMHQGDVEQLRKRLPLMQRNAERLLALIGQLLDLSKLEAGGMQLHARRIDLVPFLRQLTQVFTSRAERQGLTLVFDPDVESLRCYVDVDKLEKVLLNLLSNAFKFTDRGGKVRVRLTQRRTKTGAWADIAVQDTGCGIPAEELARIFDRFYQVEGGTMRPHEGTGIGLALARELVELHQGTITVESTEQFGSTFTVRLPLGRAHLQPSELAEAPGPEAVQHPQVYAFLSEGDRAAPEDAEEPEKQVRKDRPTVLVIEDNVDMRAYLRSHLVPNYRVVEAADGAAGLEAVRRLTPDLVISDVMMPRLDGYAVCQAIKTDARLEHVPVVLLTARADEESKLEGLETGADDFLAKPFNAEELLLRAENLIELRRKLRARFGGRIVVGPSQVVVSSAEAVFMEQVRDVVEAHLDDTHFGVDRLAAEVGLSVRQLLRRVKEATGLTPNGYIRMLRLERAACLLEQRAGTVSEIAYQVGFKQPEYFSKLFRQVFGVPPSAYASEQP